MDNQQKLLDFRKVINMFRTHKKKYFKILPAVLIGTYLLTLFPPRYYKCEVILAPESDMPFSGGALSSAMSSLGLGGHNVMSTDAISPELYPDLLSSNNFLIQMFPVEVKTKKGDLQTYYFDYLVRHQKEAWWNKCIGYVLELIKPTIQSKYDGKSEINVLNLSKQEQDIAGLIKRNISCDINQKTGAVSITVTDQDPLICATIANATLERIQKFIIDYRTTKARNDLRYYEKLNIEAKHDYEKARQRYAAYSDANMDVNLTSIRSKMEDLENEMQLRYNIYSATNSQRQQALHKIQERTPAFTILQSATIPTKPAGPKRMFISIGIMIAVFFGMSIYYLKEYIC